MTTAENEYIVSFDDHQRERVRELWEVVTSKEAFGSSVPLEDCISHFIEGAHHKKTETGKVHTY